MFLSVDFLITYVEEDAEERHEEEFEDYAQTAAEKRGQGGNYTPKPGKPFHFSPKTFGQQLLHLTPVLPSSPCCYAVDLIQLPLFLIFSATLTRDL